MNNSRRSFLIKSGQFLLGTGLLGWTACNNTGQKQQATEEAISDENLFFSISLAQWSLHRALQSGRLDNLDFAATARNDFGIGAVEYVNSFFKEKAEDQAYLADMKQRAADHEVKSLLIMIDGEGNLGATDEQERSQAVENHYKWVEAARFLGCHSIRVNAAGRGTAEEVAAAATDGLARLALFAQDYDINVLVENHGGYSSDGSWLSGVIRQVNLVNCGTLPDFGNFCIRSGQEGCIEAYDRYQGMRELMPFAKAVSAKSHDFDTDGNEIHTDYPQILQIVKEAGYTGYIGIEYEGSELSEEEGIRATLRLLRQAGSTLS